jgi:two-component system response regulator RegA
MPGDHVLVVEDDAVASQLLARALRKHGYLVETAAGVQEALALCGHWPAQAAVIDLKLGSESGLKLLPALLRVRPGIRVLMLTGYASVATAVQAIKLGASDYLAKPIEVTQIIRVLSGNGLQALREIAPGRPSVRRLEWEYIHKVLAEHDGNISETARILGIQRRTLQRKLSRRPTRT